MTDGRVQDIRERAGYLLGGAFVLGSVGLGVLGSKGSPILGTALLAAMGVLMVLFSRTWKRQFEQASPGPGEALPKSRLVLAGMALACLFALFLAMLVNASFTSAYLPAMTFLVLAVFALVRPLGREGSR